MIIEVKLEGIQPGILMHNPINALKREKTGTRGANIPTKESEAEASCYWDKGKKELVFPGDNLIASIAQAGSAWKVGKTRLSPFLSSCLRTDPGDLSFGTNKYEIFEKRVVIQRNAVLRARPLLPAWILSFRLVVEDEYFPIQKERLFEDLKLIVQEAGGRIGIGDWRPSRKGRFGRFKITKWELAEK